MELLTSVFSTRELAVGFWMAAAVLVALLVPSVRRSAKQIFQTLASPIFLKLGSLLAVYVVGVVWVLSVSGFWDASLLKDTIYWVLFSGVFIAGRSLSNSGDERLLRNLAADHVKIIVVLEGLVAAHTFALLWELILVPVVTFIAMIQAFAGRAEYRQVERAAGRLLAMLGCLIIGSVVSRVLQDPGGLLDGVLVQRVTLPLILSIAFLPAAAGLALYSAYETLFLKLNIGPPKEPPFKRYAKWRLFRHLGWRPNTVWRFSKRWFGPLMRVQSKPELEDLLTEDLACGAEEERSAAGEVHERQTSHN